MTDAEYRQQVERIETLRKKWVTCLGLRWWTIHMRFYRDEPIEGRAGESWSCLGKADVRWEYLRATLHFDLNKLQSCDDDEAENVFVHECCHVLVHEMRGWHHAPSLDSEDADCGMAHEERVVTTLASAFIWTYGAGAKTVTDKPIKKLGPGKR